MKKIVIPLILLFLLVVFVDLARGVEEIKYYPDFLKLVEEDKIKEVKFYENTLYASLEDGETIRTVKPREEDIYKLLMEKEIPFSANSSFRRRDYPSFIDKGKENVNKLSHILPPSCKTTYTKRRTKASTKN